MTKKLMVGIVATIALGASLFTFWPAGANHTGQLSDFTLYDETSGDGIARCRTTDSHAFVVRGSFTAIGGAADLRVVFQDDDFIDYPIPQDTSFSFTHAAGGTDGVDNVIRIQNANEDPGQLAGWLSANRSNGSEGEVACNSGPPK